MSTWNGDGLDPSGVLGVTQFAQIKKSFLERTTTARLADVFNDAIVAMLLAILLAGDEAQKHNLARVCQSHRGMVQGGGSSLQLFWGFWSHKTSILLWFLKITFAKTGKNRSQYRKSG